MPLPENPETPSNIHIFLDEVIAAGEKGMHIEELARLAMETGIDFETILATYLMPIGRKDWFTVRPQFVENGRSTACPKSPTIDEHFPDPHDRRIIIELMRNQLMRFPSSVREDGVLDTLEGNIAVTAANLREDEAIVREISKRYIDLNDEQKRLMYEEILDYFRIRR